MKNLLLSFFAKVKQKPLKMKHSLAFCLVFPLLSFTSSSSIITQEDGSIGVEQEIYSDIEFEDFLNQAYAKVYYNTLNAYEVGAGTDKVYNMDCTIHQWSSSSRGRITGFSVSNGVELLITESFGGLDKTFTWNSSSSFLQFKQQNFSNPRSIQVRYRGKATCISTINNNLRRIANSRVSSRSRASSKRPSSSADRARNSTGSTRNQTTSNGNGSYTYNWWSKGCIYDVYTFKVPSNIPIGASITCRSYSFHGRVDGSNKVSLKINAGEHYLIKILYGHRDICGPYSNEKRSYDTRVEPNATESNGITYELDPGCD